MGISNRELPDNALSSYASRNLEPTGWNHFGDKYKHSLQPKRDGVDLSGLGRFIEKENQIPFLVITNPKPEPSVIPEGEVGLEVADEVPMEEKVYIVPIEKPKKLKAITKRRRRPRIVQPAALDWGSAEPAPKKPKIES